MACTTPEMTFMWTMAGMTPLEVGRFNGPSKGYLRPLTLAQKPLWYLCRGEGHSGLHPFLSPKLLYICTLPGTFLPPHKGERFFCFCFVFSFRSHCIQSLILSFSSATRLVQATISLSPNSFPYLHPCSTHCLRPISSSNHGDLIIICVRPFP